MKARGLKFRCKSWKATLLPHQVPRPPMQTWMIKRGDLNYRAQKSRDKSIRYQNEELPNLSRLRRLDTRFPASLIEFFLILQSAASGTLLLTAANLANLAAIHPSTVTAPKQIDTASVASSTHFTVVNGLGRPTTVYRKSWCARNQLTVLVCTMSFLFMVGLLAGILYMESEYLPQ